MTQKIWRENFEMPKGIVDYKILFYVPWAFIDYAKKTGASDKMKESFLIFKNQGCKCYVLTDQIDQYIEDLIKKVLNDRDWTENIHEKCFKLNKKYFDYARSIESLDIKSLSDEQLIKINYKLVQLQIDSHMIAVSTTWFIDSNGETFSKYVIGQVEQSMPKNSEINPIYVFSILTTPTKESLAQQEEKEFLEIAEEVFKDKDAKNLFNNKNIEKIETDVERVAPKIKEKVVGHYRKWRWVPYGYLGPAYDLKHYFKTLSELAVNDIDIRELLEESRNRNKIIEQKQQQLKKTLNLPKKVQYLLKISQDIIWLKDYRKYCIFYGCYVLDMLHKEVARRLNLSLSQVNYFLPQELEQAMLTKKYDIDLLNERKRLSVIWVHDGKQDIFIGEEAENFLTDKKIEKIKVDNSEGLQGTCACPGSAKGEVKIINSPDEMNKMNKGDVMVSHTTFPSLLPAMKRASAIVTEDGGITCHAAIVSRELNIPCVVGIKIATKVLKDGDLVEVDAERGVVKILK